MSSNTYIDVFMAGHGRVVLEKVLVFAKSISKQQPMRLYILSGRRDGAVLKHRALNTVTLNVLSSKEPLRITMVGVLLNLPYVHYVLDLPEPSEAPDV